MINKDLYKSNALKAALKIAIIYAVFGALWILFSDKVVAYFVKDLDLITQIQTYKGWGFILLTAVLVFLLIFKQMIIIEGLNARLQQHVNKLEAILPICSICKKIRTPNADPFKMNSWVNLESYITGRTSSQFSHGLCPDCVKTHYPEMDSYPDNSSG